MQAGVDKLASVVGVTLGPKVRTPERRQRRVCKRRATFCRAALPGTHRA